ncbi:hypothetical protein BC828DRAFT_387002 [Blastocladiella britannica]|nr:hypothetical protein BC828DRAFT_387002 [Blastocladiella britannica]
MARLHNNKKINNVIPTLVVLLAVAATLAACQTAAQINATAQSTRYAWCTQQTAICSNLCGYKTTSNVCNYNTLVFSCVCGNGTSLNFNETADQTIPYFTCLNYKWLPCFQGCPAGSQVCVDGCNTQYVCGKVKANPNATLSAINANTGSTDTIDVSLLNTAATKTSSPLDNEAAVNGGLAGAIAAVVLGAVAAL